MPISPSLCGIFWLELLQALCPWHSLCELLCASTLSDSYNLSAFSSTYIPEPQGEGFDKGTPFRAECSKVLHSLLIAVHCKRKLLWWGLSEGLIYGCSGMSLGVIWLLRSFSRTVVADFPQGSQSISSQAPGLIVWTSSKSWKSVYHRIPPISLLGIYPVNSASYYRDTLPNRVHCCSI